MKIRPNYQFEDYEPFGKLYLKNPKQAARYDANGVKPCDIIRDGDTWMWVFDSKEVNQKGLFDAWCRHELQQISS